MNDECNIETIVLPNCSITWMCHSFDDELERQMYCTETSVNENELKELINWAQNHILNNERETELNNERETESR